MAKNKGRHARPKDNTKLTRAATTAGVLGAGVAIPLSGIGNTASAASVSTWDKVAACESTNNWSINTGNGFYGGLQFTAQTWTGFGGTKYAPRADLATKAEQITIAEKVLAVQGPGAWPTCGPKAGLTKNGSAPAFKAPKAAPKKSTKSSISAGQKAVQFAKAQVGERYVYGANGPSSWDCSSLVQAAWKSAGVNIPRTTHAQWAALPKVSMSNLQPGDLILYNGHNHVAMYLGGGKIVEAANPSRGVRISTVYAWNRVTGAVRPKSNRTFSAPAPKPNVTKPKAKAKTEPKVEKPVKKVETAGTHTVVSGDTLWDIALDHNVKGHWPALYAANKAVVGSDPDLIFPGQVIRLPKS